ncbi:hypothetical protein [Pseudovibrio sp. POLY-S9]|uniref:hypothetical protein n=1 Tax=Pseudovibrio sp. POLY-S9 TaxID=1576596 RepID=UPI000AC4D8FF|nr:hypothetical protein [Pseudovibrio sp. POLY-S9]
MRWLTKSGVRILRFITIMAMFLSLYALAMIFILRGGVPDYERHIHALSQAISNCSDYEEVKRVYEAKDTFRVASFKSFMTSLMDGQKIYKAIKVERLGLLRDGSCAVESKEATGRNTDPRIVRIFLKGSFGEILDSFLVAEIGARNPKVDVINRLKELIVEHNQRNPYDGLTFEDKTVFENIEQILGDNTAQIASNLGLLSRSIVGKDRDIERYLANANWGYYISIIALTLTLFQVFYGAYSIWKRNRDSP